MRALLYALGAATLLGVAHSAPAQTWSPSVNQRMDPPTSQADGYVGVSLGQLIMALGLTLQGTPPPGLDDIRLLRPKQTAAAPAPPETRPADAAGATVPAATKPLDPTPTP